LKLHLSGFSRFGSHPASVVVMAVLRYSPGRLSNSVTPMITKTARFSYVFMLIALVLVAWLHLATPLLTAVFCYFALEKICFKRQKLLAVLLFAILLTTAGYGFVYFFKQAYITLPKVAETSIPIIVEKAERFQIELPFTDMASLKVVLLEALQQIRYLTSFAKIALKEIALFIIGVVVAVSVFANAKLDLDRGNYRLRNNLYSVMCDQIAARFRTFYSSFRTVMGAQLIISAINTTLTAVFVFWIGLPYASLVVVVTFLCGMLPIIGNILSNTVIVGIALTVSPTLAVWALIFLIVLHKLEYFLNSQIIGTRIKNPMWLTLIGLILGERLMGIPGMILAPVVLHYIKAEMSNIQAPDGTVKDQEEDDDDAAKPVEMVK
jgi:predicted PurR-regulated permease PerM